MSGSAAGPLLPLPTAPPILLPGGPTSREMGEESSPHPAENSQVAEAKKEGLARPWPACPRGLWEEDRSGRIRTGARPAQIQDGATCAGSPMSWETALGASNSG